MTASENAADIGMKINSLVNVAEDAEGYSIGGTVILCKNCDDLADLNEFEERMNASGFTHENDLPSSVSDSIYVNYRRGGITGEAAYARVPVEVYKQRMLGELYVPRKD